MASFKGFYINLKKDKERDFVLRKELERRGRLSKYEKFTAVEGNTEEASKRSLKAGEDGIWKSWIKLLEMIENDSNKNYVYVHIIEDDAIVSDQLYSLIDQLSDEEPMMDILMTDMYTNTSIYKAFEKNTGTSINKNAQWKLFTTNDYTGCAASCIIHKNKISKIRRLLQEKYRSKKLIPIDNYLRMMSKQGVLTITTTIPFLTTVQLSSITKSTIQNRKEEEVTITKTQIYNTYLRRRLSIFRESTDINEIVKIAKEIIGTNSHLKDRFEVFLIESMNSFLEREEAFRYRIDERIEDDDNPQYKT